MADARLLWRVRLRKGHEPTGMTRHYRGGTECAPPAELRIVQFQEDPGFYLLYCDDAGREVTDTYHETVNLAMAQAEFEFNVKPGDWEAGP